MAIHFRCRCGEKITAPEEHAGKEIRCLACGERVVIPEPGLPGTGGTSRPVAVAPTTRRAGTGLVQAGTAVAGAGGAPKTGGTDKVEPAAVAPTDSVVPIAAIVEEASGSGPGPSAPETVKTEVSANASRPDTAKTAAASGEPAFVDMAEAAAGVSAAAAGAGQADAGAVSEPAERAVGPKVESGQAGAERQRGATTAISLAAAGIGRRKRALTLAVAVAAALLVGFAARAFLWPGGAPRTSTNGGTAKARPDDSVLREEIARQVLAAVDARARSDAARADADKAGAAKGAPESWSAAEKLRADAVGALDRREFETATKRWTEAAQKYAAAKRQIPLTPAQRFERLKGSVFTLSGHNGPVNGVDVAPDGNTVASAGRDGTVRLWDITKKQQIVSLTGHSGEVNAVAFSEDGKWLASAGADKSVRLWDLAKKEQAAELKGHTDRVTCVAFHPRSHLVASGGEDRSVRLWDVATRQLSAKYEDNESPVRGLAFTADGKLLVAGGMGFLRMWNEDHRRVGDVPGRRLMVGSVACSPDGKTTATLGMGGVSLWETQTRRFSAMLPGGGGGGPMFPFRDPRGAAPSGVAFGPDSRLIACTDNDAVQVWDVEGQRRVGSLGGYRGRVNAVALSPDGSRLVTGGADGGVKVWGEADK